MAVTLILFTGMNGCYDYSKFDNITIDPITPKLVVPAISSTITFKELAERNDANTIIIQKPGDTKFYLAFRDTIDVGSAASEFSIPSVSYNQTFQLNAGEIPLIPVPAGETFGPITKNFSETYAPVTGAELKSIILTQGSLSCTIRNNFQNEISGTLTINSLQNSQGNPLVINIPAISPTGNNTYLQTADISGYTIDLYDDVADSYNNFSFTASFSVTSQGYPITASDNISIDVSLDNLDFSYIIGKINMDIPLDDHDYKVDIFRSSYIADQHLAEPKLLLKFVNGYGIPFAFNVNSFEASNTSSGETSYLANDATTPDGSLLIGSPNSIDYVHNIGDNPALDSLLLDKDNSNLEYMFDLAPNQFKLSSSITLGDATDNHDYFINKNADLSLISEIELPLVGWVETNEVNDTIRDVDLPDLEDELNLKESDSLKITVKFKFNNSIPLNAYFQAYFLDDSNNELTTLFDDQLWLIKSSEVNPSTGKTTAATTNYSETVVTKSKYNVMKDATKIVLQVKFTTGGSPKQTIIIETTNSIDIQMSILAEGIVNFDI